MAVLSFFCLVFFLFGRMEESRMLLLSFINYDKSLRMRGQRRRQRSYL